MPKSTSTKPDLTINYGGLKLKNPIVMGASNLVTDVANLEKLEEAGAAAVVYKSLFEEQIQLESYQLDQVYESFSNWDAEHETLLPTSEHAGPAEHLRQLKEARKHLTIPLIGSLNCVHNDSWVEFAMKMEDTGINALELNFYSNVIDVDLASKEIEEQQLLTLVRVKSKIHIPVFIKLSPYYTNTMRLITQMDSMGANGFVLFNRLFQPDIDVDKEEHHYPYLFCNENDNRLALRYAGLLYKNILGSVICNTGIITGKDVVKMILAGGSAVQIVSAVYKKGISTIPHMLDELETWMTKKDYPTIESFQGKLSKENLPDPFAYKRAQYVDILMKSDLFVQYHPKEDSSNIQLDY